MILISSAAGLKGQPFLAPYVASKHGMVGVMRTLANELASHSIRVNSVHPTGVDTPMLVGLGGPDRAHRGEPRRRPHVPQLAAGRRDGTRATSATPCSSSPLTSPAS
jgi:NAD(P)-dependent dehydrogenase (short-subunit alcohol dehydrogenase family)